MMPLQSGVSNGSPKWITAAALGLIKAADRPAYSLRRLRAACCWSCIFLSAAGRCQNKVWLAKEKASAVLRLFANVMLSQTGPRLCHVLSSSLRPFLSFSICIFDCPSLNTLILALCHHMKHYRHVQR